MKKSISTYSIVLVLVLVMVIGTGSSAFATTAYLPEREETVVFEGNTYTFVSENTSEERTTYIYDANENLIAKASFNSKTRVLETIDYENGITIKDIVSTEIKEDLSLMGGGVSLNSVYDADYKLVSSYSDSLFLEGVSAAALAVTIGTIVPGLGAGYALNFASIALASGATMLYYTCDLYSARGTGNTYYFKRVFKAYMNGTTQQVGPTLTGYTTTHK